MFKNGRWFLLFVVAILLSLLTFESIGNKQKVLAQEPPDFVAGQTVDDRLVFRSRNDLFTLVDTNDGSIVNEYSGTTTENAFFNCDGTRLFIYDQGDLNLITIDSQTGEILNTIHKDASTSFRPEDLSCSPKMTHPRYY